MKSRVLFPVAALVLLSLQPLAAKQGQGRDAQLTARDPQSGAPPMTGQEPSQFEQFVAKLKVDEKKQLPQVQQIMQAAGAEAAPIEREMMKLRMKMLEVAGKPDELAAATTAYQAAAVKMTNAEIKAFGDVKAILKPNQTDKAAEAFVLMAGIFHPQTARTSGRRPGGGGEVRYASSGFSGTAAPQRGGGSRGGGGVPSAPPSRFVVLATALSVAEDNRKPIKETLDSEYKAAAPLRDQLTKARATLAQAVASGSSSDAAVNEYAAAVAAMATDEMKALAKVMAAVPADQRQNARLDTAVSLMRGAFVGKKWDMTPDTRFY